MESPPRLSRTGDASQSNAYNGLDDRVSVTSASTTHRFVYDPDARLVGEYDSSGAPVAETIWLSPEVENDNQPFGGGDGIGGYAPLAVVTGSGGSAATYWVHANHIGVPLVTTDASGAVASPSGYTVLGFPGQTRTLADLYYNRYRDYDSSLGRYIQADPIGLGGGDNPYLYASANPLRNSDPLGLYCKSMGGWTTCVYPGGPAFRLPTPAGFRDFSGDELLYHKYDITRAIGCANPNAVMRALINNPTPGNPSPATPGGTPNNAVVLFNNPVTSYLTTDLTTGAQLVVNITGPNSLFYSGYAARVVTNGVAHTYGEGDNWKQSPLLAYAGLGLIGLAGQSIGDQIIWGLQTSRLISQCGCQGGW